MKNESMPDRSPNKDGRAKIAKGSLTAAFESDKTDQVVAFHIGTPPKTEADPWSNRDPWSSTTSQREPTSTPKSNVELFAEQRKELDELLKGIKAPAIPSSFAKLEGSHQDLRSAMKQSQ